MITKRTISISVLAGVFAVTCPATAQQYPARPVRVIVGAPAGGPQDILARLMGQWLSERLGRQFVIENRPGAGSNIAAEAVVTRFTCPPHQTRSTRRSTTISNSISFTTLRQSRALSACQMLWRSIRQCRPQ